MPLYQGQTNDNVSIPAIILKVPRKINTDELLSASAPYDISKISQLFSDIRYVESQEYYVQYNVYQSGNGPILVLYVRDPDLSIMKKVYKEYLVGAVEADKNKPESAVRTIEEILYDLLYFLDGEIIPISGKKDKKVMA